MSDADVVDQKLGANNELYVTRAGFSGDGGGRPTGRDPRHDARLDPLIENEPPRPLALRLVAYFGSGIDEVDPGEAPQNKDHSPKIYRQTEDSHRDPRCSVCDHEDTR